MAANILTVTIPAAPLRDAMTTALARVNAVLAAANSLLRDGYTITAFRADALCAKPILWIEATPRLAVMVENDLATYYRRGYDERGAYRIGQFDRLGVAVMWEERDWRH